MYSQFTLHFRSFLISRVRSRQALPRLFGGVTFRQYAVDVGKYTERVRQLAAEKGLNVEQLIEQTKLAQAEDSRRLRHEREAVLVAQKINSSNTPTSANLYAKSRTDNTPVKPLSSILNTSRILSTPHTPDQIAQLWSVYHMSRSGGTGRGFLCASIPIDLYKKMSAFAEKYPTFVVPIRRPRDTSTPLVNGESETAYEFFLLQWEFFDAPNIPSTDEDLFAKPPSSESPNPKISVVLFTPLEEYKLRNTYATPYLSLTNYTDLASSHGLVLLRGEITPRSSANENYMLNQDDAQQLSMAVQKFYLWGDGEREGGRLVKTFHEKPEEFKWEDLLKAADWGI